ncbi:Amuc_1102 family pilus-like protein [Sulfuriroseicoccus oceanibius]|uniref:Uncharacterized protein n=1 Tax=Sulfuriroseicoccus oceanibius TaxID=2707525 RepID=A0A6B3LDA3_9BACT|nr:Amuc_1102 family pilus-like protein [Sulfuriroseicoccus oceanibius]QQL44518.1 hypothetical protein G3M56_011595 [Sulfuriroseicoccus oceanibius]
MKTLQKFSRSLALAVVGMAALPTYVSAQVQHKVEVKKVEVEMQQTPRYAAAGPRDKRWDQLEWLEIEVELDVDSRAETKVIPELTATFYVALPNEADRAARYVMLSDSITFTNIRAGSKKAYLVAYVDPDTLARFVGKDKPSKGDVQSVGVTVTAPNISMSKPKDLFASTKGGEWWKKWSDPRESGLIRAKGNTPFALLWYDRYPQTRQER